MAIRALVWNENEHEKVNALVRRLYPDGIHAAIAKAFDGETDIQVETATLDMPEHGLTEEVLARTDVLLWWGHRAHGKVDDAIVERVQKRVWEGMGLIVLHSGHFSKIFKRLMGTPCSLKWREAGEVERVWVINRNHPIAAGLPEYIEIEHEEMYGEPFTIPSLWRRSSSHGSKGERCSAPASLSSAVPDASSTSAPGMRPTRLIIAPRCFR